MTKEMERLKEIEARKAALLKEIESPDITEERLGEIKSEAGKLATEATELRSKMDLRNNLLPGEVLPSLKDPEDRASNFAKNLRTRVGAKEVRSVLVSGGTLATPTEVDPAMNDKQGAKVSSIIDLVRVVSCNGMSCDRVPYVAADTADAAEQTEGQAATEKEPTYAYVDITPASVAVTAQISKQAKKQSPIDYEANVRGQSLLSLRKKASAIVVSKLKASSLVKTVDATVKTGKGVIDENTLRKLALNYGGDEGVDGEATLVLNKADLIAFGDVRGSNEKKAVYDITPDSMNPNTGIIKDGGLAVRYCLNKNVDACSGTAQPAASGTALKTMFYGQMQNFKLDLFSDYEIRVSEDFAITSLMDTIVGDVEIGGDVVVKDGFVCLTIPKAAT